jgi:hypothetical protein
MTSAPRLALALVVLALPGCFLIPRPHRFEDVDASHLVSVQSYAAWSDGSTLVLDLTPYNKPYRGLWYFVEGGNLYLNAHYDSVFGVPNILTIGEDMLRSDQFFRDGDRAVLRYRIDMAKLGFADDWSSHVFWLVETPWFLIPGPAVFMESRREPAKRKAIVVGDAPPREAQRLVPEPRMKRRDEAFGDLATTLPRSQAVRGAEQKHGGDAHGLG